MYCSDLLDDKDEPFEVIPDARLGPALMAALYILFAPDTLFSAWRTVDDAANSMHQQAQQVAGAEADKVAPSTDDKIDLDTFSVTDACKWLPEAALEALRQALDARAQRYPTASESDHLAVPKTQSKKLTSSAVSGPHGQQVRRAALTLAAAEQQLLKDCLQRLSETQGDARQQKRRRKRS